jgi:hypothetical protein
MKSGTLDITVDVAKEVLRNLAMAIPAVRTIRTRRGRTSLPPHPSQLERYATTLLRYCSKEIDVRDADVLEIGPGDHLASGLAFVACGAKSYTSCDRFLGDYASESAKQWYKMVAEHWPPDLPEWPEALNPALFPEGMSNVHSLAYAIEDKFDAGPFDLICSYAVGEHVSDVRAFAALTRRLLRPNGVAVHTVDFTPHNCWRTEYEDPYIFLRFPDFLWRLMGSQRGTPNRVRFHEYKAILEEAGLAVDVRNRIEAFKGYEPPRRLVGVSRESLETGEATFVCKALAPGRSHRHE